jgi:recombinational DNA repair ATPase RecF
MPITLEFTYRESILDERKVAGELALGRTLFGAHLDDINLIFKASSGNRSSRTQLSRGQQALLAAVWRITALTQGPPCILALDDVVGELDAQKLIDFIFYAVPTHAHQLIIAVPDISAAFIQKISERGMNVQKYRLGD